MYFFQSHVPRTCVKRWDNLIELRLGFQLNPTGGLTKKKNKSLAENDFLKSLNKC